MIVLGTNVYIAAVLQTFKSQAQRLLRGEAVHKQTEAGPLPGEVSAGCSQHGTRVCWCRSFLGRQTWFPRGTLSAGDVQPLTAGFLWAEGPHGGCGSGRKWAHAPSLSLRRRAGGEAESM